MNACRKQSGFGLLELAIALLIIALSMAYIAPAISELQKQKKIEADRAQLKLVKEALLNYVVIHGRLPCPATHPSLGGSVSDSGGLANPETPAFPPTIPPIICTVQQGMLPARTLNLPGVYTNAAAMGLLPNQQHNGAILPEYAVRYTLTNLTGTSPIYPHAFANTQGRVALNGVRIADINASLNRPNLLVGNGLSVCASLTGITTTSCGSNNNVYVTDIVALIHSRGANPTTPSSDEQQNTNLGMPRIFIFPQALRRDNPTNPFDDEIEVITFQELVGVLSKGGWILNP